MRKTKLKLISTFFSILLITAGCHKAEQSPILYDLTTEEKTWLEEFFTGVMLQNPAIYTLRGSKPMTRISIHYYTDEEIQAYYDQMSEEEKKTAIYVEDYHLRQNWEKWEKIRDRLHISRFLFYKKNDTGDPKFASVYFVDPIKIAYTILENYPLFRNVVGFDFNPLQEALEIEKGSAFWERVNGNATLIGLLYGFGLKNSSLFYWKYWGQCEDCNSCFSCLTSYASDSLKDGTSTIKNLTLPAFASFFKDDDVIEKYKKERAVIQSEYRDKDFLGLTLQHLTVSGK